MILQNRLKLIVISKTVPFYISTYIYFFFTYSFFLVPLEPSGLFAKEINCKRNKSNLVELCISISGEIEFTPWYSQIAIYSVGKLDLRFFADKPTEFFLTSTHQVPTICKVNQTSHLLSLYNITCHDWAEAFLKLFLCFLHQAWNLHKVQTS